jgi:hypothetical protein
MMGKNYADSFSSPHLQPRYKHLPVWVCSKLLNSKKICDPAWDTGCSWSEEFNGLFSDVPAGEPRLPKVCNFEQTPSSLRFRLVLLEK